MEVLLVDLDDTLIADVAARDRALTEVLFDRFDSGLDLASALSVVRQEWRDSSLRSLPVLAGVSSWEALWTDFDAVVSDATVKLAGQHHQERVWQQLLPDQEPAVVAAAFRLVREELVQPFE